MSAKKPCRYYVAMECSVWSLTREAMLRFLRDGASEHGIALPMSNYGPVTRYPSRGKNDDTRDSPAWSRGKHLIRPLDWTRDSFRFGLVEFEALLREEEAR